jgi:hypothetical protein
MAAYISGILTVPSFNPTGNPGEYTISGATYNNQSDNAGAGTSALAIGFVLYVQSSDPNTFLQIPGVAHRYKITALTIVDIQTINATVLWDEQGPELDTPTNGIACIISETTPTNKLGFFVEESLYTALPTGILTGAMSSDTSNIGDSFTSNLVAGANITITETAGTNVIASTGANEGTYE